MTCFEKHGYEGSFIEDGYKRAEWKNFVACIHGLS